MSQTRAIIDLQAFRHNLDVVRECVGQNVRIMAIVKADAYGHGWRRISEEAVRQHVAYLGVARASEAFQLRSAGLTLPILVLEILPDEFLLPALEQGIDVTASSVDFAVRCNAIAQRLQRMARIHVKVDTGMGRLGFAHERAAGCIETIARLTSVEIQGVYSHFATSEGSDQEFAHLQLERFNAVLNDVRARRIEVPLVHMANSGAILTLPASHFNLVRPGIMLYGYPPASTMKGDLRPVMSLVSRVVLVKSVAAGTSISYGRRYFTSSKTRIATVPVGYGDGYSRLLTNKADVLIRGKRFPVAGTICMDHLMVDVGESDVKEGDEVTLIGKNGNETITGWDIAEKLGTIPYEVTCLITQRVPRVFTP